MAHVNTFWRYIVTQLIEVGCQPCVCTCPVSHSNGFVGAELVSRFTQKQWNSLLLTCGDLSHRTFTGVIRDFLLLFSVCLINLVLAFAIEWLKIKVMLNNLSKTRWNLIENFEFPGGFGKNWQHLEDAPQTSDSWSRQVVSFFRSSSATASTKIIGPYLSGTILVIAFTVHVWLALPIYGYM